MTPDKQDPHRVDKSNQQHLGGYLLVDADDLDAALAIAVRIPAARMGGAVEVRPLVAR